ncbi:hypothetical protein R3O67_27990 [Bacillus cereus]|uniref:hypothetical protein n=1 Tax=Bacillus cereus TaxID=1396 RepID=UPI003079F7F0
MYAELYRIRRYRTVGIKSLQVNIQLMTGVGKSTLLENMLVNDIESGNGVVVSKIAVR